MCNRNSPSVSRISQTELDLVSSQCDSGVSQVPSCKEVPVGARGWEKPQNYLATIINNPRRLSERTPVDKEASDYLEMEPNVCEQELNEESDDNEVEEINFDLNQTSANEELHDSDLYENIYDGSYGLGAAHDPIVRGECLNARISNPSLIQNEFEKRYINSPYPEDHPDVKRINLPPAQRKEFNLKQFQQQYPIYPGSVPKLPENRANFSHLSTTRNPRGGADRRQSMPEECNAIYAGMERQRRMKTDRERTEEQQLQLFDEQRGEIGKANCEADLKGLAHVDEPQQRPPSDRPYPEIRVIKPSADLPVGPKIPVQDRKYLVVPGGNQKSRYRLPTHPDEVICNEDQNSSAESYSTLNEAFCGGEIPVCDLTYTIADSPAEQISPYGGSTNIPPQPRPRRSPEHYKGSKVSRQQPRSRRSQVSRLSTTCPGDASPKESPAHIRRTPKRPVEAPARPRFPEIRQQVQNFFDNREQPAVKHVRPRVRFQEPLPEVAEPVCPRARGIVPADVIQTGVYYCGINNVCQANDPPCVPQRERRSPPPGTRAPIKRPPSKRLSIKRSPIKCPSGKFPPGKFPPGKFPPGKPGDPRKCSQSRLGLPKVPRPWTEPIPKKKKDFKLTEEQKALVLDNYYPGLIHDAVNQNADFNEVARKFVTPESAVDGDKAEKGMSLLEAFDTRVKFEQISMKSLLSTAPTNGKKGKNVPPPYQLTYRASANPITNDVIREDNVRPTAIVDLQQFVRSAPESDPVRAIACLTRAQHLNDYYKEYRAAQLAVQTAPPDKIEQAALFGVKSFQIDSLTSDSKTVHSEYYKSLELVSYVGVTKPN